MIYTLVFYILFSIIAIADDCLAPIEEAEKLGQPLMLPNCITENNISNAQNSLLEPLCKTCKNKFELISGLKVPKTNKQDLQKDFFRLALEEYKKNVINNIISAVKLRSLPSTGSNFSKSTVACKMKAKKDILTNCKSPTARKLIEDSNALDDISKSVTNELSKILSTKPDYIPTDTLLKRNKTSCFIPEKEILQISSSAIEDQFSPKMIQFFKSANLQKYSSVEEIFGSDEFQEVYDEDPLELSISIKSHPLFSILFESPSRFKSFFQSIKPPEDKNDLKASLYGKSNGEAFDETLAKNCTGAFEAFSKAICSQDFEEGKINTDPFENLEKLYDVEISDNEATTTDQDIKKNIDVLKFCEIKNEKSFLNLTTVNKEIGSGLNTSYQKMSLENYKNKKYDSEIGLLNDYLCKNINKDCSGNFLSCKILKKYNERLKNPQSLDSKLASSSNKEVNSLLRAMIGDTTNIDLKTKEILITEGIIPKSDGTMVAQPDIPERRPDYFSKMAASTPTQSGKVQSAPASAQTAARSATRKNSDYSDSAYSNVDTPTASALPNFSDILNESKELREIQDEIKRRLEDLPNNRPASKTAAKKIVNDAFKAKGQPLASHIEEALANRIMESEASRAPASTAFAQNQGMGNSEQAAVSNTPSEIQKWKANQKNAALMGMAGAQQVMAREQGGNQANDAKAKELTKIAINYNDDPKIALSDIFNKKIDQNDSETQLLKVLLKSKNNFLLQVKSVNFRVIFNQRNDFTILHDSGNSQEAERIRPQLEMFLRKLKT